MRPKHQVTLPASIVRDANLTIDDRIEVRYINGVIVLIPNAKTSKTKKWDLMSYAGIGKGIWGNNTQEVDQYIHELRS